MTKPLTRAELETAISKYGPELRLHPQEQYLNCSTDWFLTQSTLIDNTSKTPPIVSPTPSQLPQPPAQGQRYSFSVLPTAKPGNFSTAKAYVNAFWKPGMSYTDLQFWFFSAYNGHATARFSSLILNKEKHEGDVDLTPLGEHWADWEYAGIRVDNASKEMIGIMLSEHGQNVFFDMVAVKEFRFVEGTERPVVYSSLNGHANFPGTGENLTDERKVLGFPVGLKFDLINVTADGGKVLDCSTRYEVVGAEWLKGTKEAYDIPLWVGYPYRWGPEGTTIHMQVKTLASFIRAALGNDLAAELVIDDPITLLASELLHIFVKADINGAAAPSTQNPWTGHY